MQYVDPLSHVDGCGKRIEGRADQRFRSAGSTAAGSWQLAAGRSRPGSAERMVRRGGPGGAAMAASSRVFTPGLQFDDVEKRVLRRAADPSAQLRELRGRLAANSF